MFFFLTRWLHKNLHVYMCLHYNGYRSLKNMVKCVFIIITPPLWLSRFSSTCLLPKDLLVVLWIGSVTLIFLPTILPVAVSQPNNIDAETCRWWVRSQDTEVSSTFPHSPLVPSVNYQCLSFHSTGTKYLKLAMTMRHETFLILIFCDLILAVITSGFWCFNY